MITDSDGEWVLTTDDIDCICFGVGILGSGGGGTSEWGNLIGKRITIAGKLIRVKNPST